jgi:adenylosuccinate lyase
VNRHGHRRAPLKWRKLAKVELLLRSRERFRFLPNRYLAGALRGRASHYAAYHDQEYKREEQRQQRHIRGGE